MEYKCGFEDFFMTFLCKKILKKNKSEFLNPDLFRRIYFLTH